MKNLLISVFMVFALFGCNFGCEVETTISNGLAGAIATALTCSNQSTIQANVASVLNLTKICGVAECAKGRKMGTVANLVCPVVASTAVAYLGNQIPADWGCAPASAGQTVTQAITASCELLPF